MPVVTKRNKVTISGEQRTAQIIKLTSDGISCADVARAVGVSKQRVYAVVRSARRRGLLGDIRITMKPSGNPLGVSSPGQSTPAVKLYNVNSIDRMIVALQKVSKSEGDLPCLMLDTLGVYSELPPLVVKDLSGFDVVGSVLPPGIGNGSRVVVWSNTI